jgi:diguanylate cyclase (GGDEF)-like protein
MDIETSQAEERNVEKLRIEKIDRLIHKAENVEQDAVETLPKLAGEIADASAGAGYARGGIESKLLLARYAAMKDDYIEAIRLSSEALRRFEETGYAMGRIKALSTLGFSYGQLGKLDTALAHFLDGLKLFNEGGFTGADAEVIKGNLLSNLASIYGDLGRTDEALDVLQEVLKQAEKTGSAPLVVALSNICEAYLNKGDIMSALVYNQRALMEIKTKNLGNMHLYACHNSFGMIYERSGQADKALASYTEALDCASRVNNRFSTAAALVSIGRLQLKLGSRAEALEKLEKALALADKIKAGELQRSIHSLLVESSEEAGNFQEAYRHLKQYVEIDKALETREIERRLSNYSAELKVEQIQKDAEIYRLKNVELKEKSDEIEHKAQELEESFRNIKVISEIGQKITNSLDVEMVLSTIYEHVNKLMDASIFAIGFFDDAMGIVDYRMIIENARKQPLFQTSIDDGNSIASAVINSGREIMLNDAQALYTENAAMLGTGAEGRRPRSVICCPLMLTDSVMGVITVQSFRTGAYTERNLETVKALASYIAIALNNSRQSEELRAKAVELELASRTDVLTGLYNRRYALEKIDEERIRFQRNARPFSIIICDIDFFKKVNDVYGHDCGDAVLRSLAAMLGKHIRKQDCLARWGGEEFLLVLPETSSQGASVLAEKLRRRVEEYEFTYAGLKLPITMTFGVAEYLSEYGIDASIVGADSALYKGKNSGRNCVVTF